MTVPSVYQLDNVKTPLGNGDYVRINLGGSGCDGVGIQLVYFSVSGRAHRVLMTEIAPVSDVLPALHNCARRFFRSHADFRNHGRQGV